MYASSIVLHDLAAPSWQEDAAVSGEPAVSLGGKVGLAPSYWQNVQCEAKLYILVE